MATEVTISVSVLVDYGPKGTVVPNGAMIIALSPPPTVSFAVAFPREVGSVAIFSFTDWTKGLTVAMKGPSVGPIKLLWC